MVNVGKYTIHGWYGVEGGMISWSKTQRKQNFPSWNVTLALPRSWPNASLKNATMGHVLRPGRFFISRKSKETTHLPASSECPLLIPQIGGHLKPPKRVTRKNLVRLTWYDFKMYFSTLEKLQDFVQVLHHHSEEGTCLAHCFGREQLRRTWDELCRISDVFMCFSYIFMTSDHQEWSCSSAEALQILFQPFDLRWSGRGRGICTVPEFLSPQESASDWNRAN